MNHLFVFKRNSPPAEPEGEQWREEDQQEAADATPRKNRFVSTWHYLFGVLVSATCLFLLSIDAFLMNWLRKVIFIRSQYGPSPDGFMILLEAMDVAFMGLSMLVLTKVLMYAKSNGRYYFYENPLLGPDLYPDLEDDKSRPEDLIAKTRIQCYESDFKMFFLLSVFLSVGLRLLKELLLTV